MKNAFILVVGIVALSGCTAQVGEPQAADDSASASSNESLSSTLTTGTTLVTTDYLNLRSGPSTGYSVIEVIPAGAVVSTVNRTSPDNGFYNVLYGEKVGWSSGLYLKVATPPSAHALDTSVVKEIVEPLGSGHDDKGTYYTDKNYWNFCAPGAVTAALSFFTPMVTNMAGKYFEEPYGPYRISTYWASSDSVNGFSTVGRAYLMHIAMESKPPNFSSAGLPSFSSYPTTGSGIGDTRDVLNWEASGHSSSWSTFFYAVVHASGLSSTTLHNDIKRDIYGGHAIVADVNTGYLPNWSRSLGHAISIVGYDDSAGTYSYVDTCGHLCNGSSQSTNGGVWKISQSKMYSAILNFGVGYVR